MIEMKAVFFERTGGVEVPRTGNNRLQYRMMEKPLSESKRAASTIWIFG